MTAGDGAPPHVRLLNRYAAMLRARHGDVPDFDPLDGGIAARLLVLLETPGPASVSTGTTSRDNPTGTARNLTRFLDGLPLSRWDTVIWNAVPWRLPAVAGSSGGRPEWTSRPPRKTCQRCSQSCRVCKSWFSPAESRRASGPLSMRQGPISP